MTPEIQAAIEEIRAAFPGHKVEVGEDTEGGAYVVVHNLRIGDQYVPTKTWVGFRLTFQYPRPDVYPHFIAGDIKRADGEPLGEAFSTAQTFWDRPAIQVSRSSKRWDATVDTAALKLAKVLDWIHSR